MQTHAETTPAAPPCKGGASGYAAPICMAPSALSGSLAKQHCEQVAQTYGWPSVSTSGVADARCADPSQRRLVCSSGETSASWCCTHASSGVDGSCSQFCPTSAACSPTLGGDGSGACFALTSNCPVNPEPGAGGDTLTQCPVMTSNDALQPLCKSWCEANPRDCNSAMRQFCSNARNAQMAACNCVAPQGKSWGDLTFNGLQSIMSYQPGFDTMDMGCVWPPCQDKSGSILQPQRDPGDTYACPTIKNLCLNLAEDVHLSDIVSGRVTVGQCVSKAQGGKAKSGGNIHGGINKLGLGQALGVWFRANPIAGIVVVVVGLILVLVAARVLFRPPSPLQKAAARMALDKITTRRDREMGELITHMTASPNHNVKSAGGVLRSQRDKERQVLQAAHDKARAERDTRIQTMRPLAKTNPAIGMSIAAMQVQNQEADRELARRLAQLR